MTDVVEPDAPAAGEPGVPRGRRHRWLRPVLAVAVVAAVAAGAALVLTGGGSSHPDAWDPRIVDLVAFVEGERGLTFDHPVEVQFLADDDFRREVTENDELDEEERAELESIEATLRALGLVTGDVDLEEIGDELIGDGVIGLYSFDDERILVRGDTLDDQRRSTLVHELTHALQDQHFDIGEFDPERSGARAAFTAVVEADAEDVEEAWRETLSDSAREQLEASEGESAAGIDFEGVPEVFVELMVFPYVFGPDFLDAVVEERGTGGRNELFTSPPTTEEHIVLPETFLDGQRAEEVLTPALEEGESLLEESEDDFGMLSLLVVLGERVDFAGVWSGVQGWAGDAMVAFERDGRTCVRAQVAFDETAQAEQFGVAFDQWAIDLPAGQRRDGRFVTFESCDPGDEATGGRPEGHVSAIQGLALRRAIAEGFESSGAPPDAAVCVADGLLERLTANRVAELDRILTADPGDPAAAEVQQAVAELVPRCR